MPTTPFIPEQTRARYTFHLVDQDGVGIASGSLNTLTLTYYDALTDAILNDRLHQDVLNTNHVTVTTAEGPPVVTTVAWELQPEDTVLVGQGGAFERHMAEFRWTWGGNAGPAAHLVQVVIEQRRHIP